MAALSMDEFEELERVAKERDEIVAKYDKGREEGAEILPWEEPAFELYHVTDRYGFIHEKLVEADEAKAKQVEKERTMKWVKMIKNWKKYFPGEKLSRRVYKGIPESLRGEIWSKLLGVNVIKAEQDGVYIRMKSRARLISPHIRQIDLDVNRTYRNNLMFRERYGVKQQALFHVLAAYSMYNTEVGYCQGMSEIAALLLMYLNEEDAFWGLSQLFTDKRHGMHGKYAGKTHNMHGLFIAKFPKLLRFQEHHENILKKFLPKVRRHLEREGIDAGLYTIKWFLQCFLDRLPFTLTLRVWDIYMLEGEKILTAMSYNIIKLHRRKIRKHRMDTLLQYFQSEMERDFGYDDDTVIDQLQLTMEELRKAKMDLPPKPKSNELPTLPFGLEIQPSIRELIANKGDESFDEHFRKNTKGGKAAYYRRRAAGGAHGTTPEMGRGADTFSLQSSRHSEYSTGDQSSFYDTAANSRLSIVDYSSKTSPKSSRTSYAEGSEMGSQHFLHQTPVPDEDEMEEEDHVENHYQRTEVPVLEPLTRDTTIEDLANDFQEQKPPSQASDYDNINGTYEGNGMEVAVEHMVSLPIQHELPVQHIHSFPISKSEGYISNKQRHTKGVRSPERGGATGGSRLYQVRESPQKVVNQDFDIQMDPWVRNDRRSPKRTTDNGQVVSTPKFVSQLEVRTNVVKQTNGFHAEMDYASEARNLRSQTSIKSSSKYQTQL